MIESIVNENIKFSYIYSCKEEDNLNKYFKMKNKNGNKFNEEGLSVFINEVVDKIGLFDLVIYPETSGVVLPQIAKICGKRTFMVRKNKKEFIQDELLKQKLMRPEKESFLKLFDRNKLNIKFKMNEIKGNQRYRLRNLLFKKPNIDYEENESILLLDDAIFSGETFIALKNAINVKTKNIVIFSKK